MNNFYILVHTYSTGVKTFGHSSVWIFSEQVFVDFLFFCVLVIVNCPSTVGLYLGCWYVCCGFCYVSLQNAGSFHFKAFQGSGPTWTVPRNAAGWGQEQRRADELLGAPSWRRCECSASCRCRWVRGFVRWFPALFTWLIALISEGSTNSAVLR